jgi:hypothetical protein
MLTTRANELEQAAEIIRSQLPFRNPIWISSMVNRNIGGDVSFLVMDVKHVETSGRIRENTWVQPGDREGVRRSRNTMGYQVRPKL